MTLGRTGTVASCYMFYSGILFITYENSNENSIGLFDDINFAASHFAKRRSLSEKGVTQPSQIRYIHYFSWILKGQHFFKTQIMKITHFSLENLGELKNEIHSIELYEYKKKNASNPRLIVTLLVR